MKTLLCTLLLIFGCVTVQAGSNNVQIISVPTSTAVAAEETIDEDGSSITNFTTDSGTWAAIGGYFKQTAQYNSAMLRHDTTVTASCQWGVVEVGAYITLKGSQGIVLRSAGSTGYKYSVRYHEGNGEVQWIVIDGTSFDETVETDTVSFSMNDTLGVQVYGTGDSTTVKWWKNPTGDTVDDWGTADGTMTTNPTNAANTGSYVGIEGYKNAADVWMDNFRAGTCSAP